MCGYDWPPLQAKMTRKQRRTQKQNAQSSWGGKGVLLLFLISLHLSTKRKDCFKEEKGK